MISPGEVFICCKCADHIDLIMGTKCPGCLHSYCSECKDVCPDAMKRYWKGLYK